MEKRERNEPMSQIKNTIETKREKKQSKTMERKKEERKGKERKRKQRKAARK